MNASRERKDFPYPNPPITEALLDIRVKPINAIDIGAFEKLYEDIKEHYPKKSERLSIQGQMGFEKEEGVRLIQSSRKVDGCVYATEDGRQIIQARLDGFTINRLKPYDNWRTLKNEAHRVWKKYQVLVEPAQITRVALRYINRIEIPMPIGDFKEYILTVPEIAHGLPQELAGYFMRLVIPEPRLEAYAIIVQTIEKPKDGKLPLVFDIDVAKNVVLDSRDEQAWNMLESLRQLKNRIFERSLTRKTKKLFS